MRVYFHPEFPKDVRRFKANYARVSDALAVRFHQELNEALQAIKESPLGAGHFLNLGSKVVRELRRRNLRAFPIFILYGVYEDQLLFGVIIPSHSDPLTWITRFE